MTIRIEIEITGIENWGTDWSNNDEREKALNELKRNIKNTHEMLGINYGNLHVDSPTIHATEEEKFPELALPKAGDWGWFWDDNKETAMIDKFSGMYAESFLSTKTIIGYLNFQKIDTSKSLDEIIKEFKTEI